MNNDRLDIREYIHAPAGKPLKVDRERGIIFGCKVLGTTSANPAPNNNEYSRVARDKVVPLMEGARAYVDHAPRSAEGQTRSYRDAFGVHKNLRSEEDGVYSDYHFPPKDELAERLFWDAENCPSRVGFSIATRVGKESQGADGRRIIEEIAFDPAIHSIDLVCRPATTRGLNESLERTAMKKTIREWIESAKGTRPGFARGLQEQAEAGILSPDATCEPGMKGPPDMPAGGTPDEPADHEAALKQGFQGAMMAVLNDDSLDMGGKLKKIKDILTAQDKLVSGGKAGGKGPADDGDEDAMEARRKAALAAGERPLIESLQLQIRSRDLCADANVRPTKVLRKALDACKSEGEMKELIEEAKAGQPGTTTTPANGQAARTPPAGGARSAAPTKELLGIREDRQTGGTMDLTKFEGEKGREELIRSLRGNGRR